MNVQLDVGPFKVELPVEGSQPQPPAQDTSTGSLLPPPMQALVTSGDLGAQIAGLLAQIGHEQKKAAHAAREAAEAAQRAAEERELQAMRNRADAKLAAGVAGGVMEVASGLVLGSGASGSGRELAAQCGSKAIDGMSKAEVALINLGADEADEKAKVASNAVSREKSSVDDARTAEKDAKDTINKALDLYKEYQGAKADAQRAAFLKA
jgi:hypothetical protein